MEQLKINTPIRLIELFAGVGTQAMALRNLGVEYENYLTCDWKVPAIIAYKEIHCQSDNADYSKDIKKEYLAEILFELGISNDGKNPMTLNQIQRKGEKWQREIYNDIKATKNIVNIQKAKGQDLKIIDREKYTYMLTYSFPCQDLSVAGKMAGMDKGAGTRSGMLWEVERLLKETEELPQILLMENVPQVMQKRNLNNFEQWQQFLEEKGYKNYAQCLNSSGFGIPQNRNRAFMVSVLGNVQYQFPEETELTKTMDDLLENEVDQKYYIDTEKAQPLIAEMIEAGRLKSE